MSDRLANEFNSLREQKRFAKLISISSVFQSNPEWEHQVAAMSKEYCLAEAKRLKIPDGWQQCGSYADLKSWFILNCRKIEPKQ